MKRIIAALLALTASAAQAQPVGLSTCQPFVKNRTGQYHVEPIVHLGQHGLHYAWSCKSGNKVTSYIYFCGLNQCNPAQLTKSLWLVTTKQSTLNQEWAKYTTVKTPVHYTDPNYALALEAQGVLDQMVARAKAKP